jgi:hypothetical protein
MPSKLFVSGVTNDGVVVVVAHSVMRPGAGNATLRRCIATEALISKLYCNWKQNFGLSSDHP